MRGLLALACRAFPWDYRARRSGELVDTALLAADGSPWRAAREALSLVGAGFRQRLWEESARPLRDGLALLAAVLAFVNLSVALAGAAFEYTSLRFLRARGFHPYPYRWEWWWIAFIVAAAAIVLGLVLGQRWLAVGAALANLRLLGHGVLFLPASPAGAGRLLSLTFFPPSYLGGRQWVAPAVVLALATAAAPMRRRPLRRFPLALVAALMLVVLSQERIGQCFVFLRWPLAALLVLAIALGAVLPRLAVLAVGVVLAAAPTGTIYLAGASLHRAPSAAGFVAAGLALGAFVPFARLFRRRLT
jgi:hypothetical protein